MRRPIFQALENPSAARPAHVKEIARYVPNKRARRCSANCSLPGEARFGKECYSAAGVSIQPILLSLRR
jgi:hypothetical protein